MILKTNNANIFRHYSQTENNDSKIREIQTMTSTTENNNEESSKVGVITPEIFFSLYKQFFDQLQGEEDEIEIISGDKKEDEVSNHVWTYQFKIIIYEMVKFLRGKEGVELFRGEGKNYQIVPERKLENNRRTDILIRDGSSNEEIFELEHESNNNKESLKEDMENLAISKAKYKILITYCGPTAKKKTKDFLKELHREHFIDNRPLYLILGIGGMQNSRGYELIPILNKKISFES